MGRWNSCLHSFIRLACSIFMLSPRSTSCRLMGTPHRRGGIGQESGEERGRSSCFQVDSQDQAVSHQSWEGWELTLLYTLEEKKGKGWLFMQWKSCCLFSLVESVRSLEVVHVTIIIVAAVPEHLDQFTNQMKVVSSSPVILLSWRLAGPDIAPDVVSVGVRLGGAPGLVAHQVEHRPEGQCNHRARAGAGSQKYRGIDRAFFVFSKNEFCLFYVRALFDIHFYLIQTLFSVRFFLIYSFLKPDSWHAKKRWARGGGETPHTYVVSDTLIGPAFFQEVQEMELGSLNNP